MKFFFLFIFSSPSRRIINFFMLKLAFCLSAGKMSAVPPENLDYLFEGTYSFAQSLCATNAFEIC